MARPVRGALIQATTCEPTTSPVAKIKQAMIDKHVAMIEEAAGRAPRSVCLQELFYGPYFCAEQDAKWYELTEQVPDGPTTKLMMELAKKHEMVMVVPLYEEEITGVYYNTAAVIDANGEYLGKFRKIHIPQCNPGFWEKFYFRPGNLGYPVFDTAVGKVGVYICYDRHFPDGARCLGLNGAEIVFNPSATVAGLVGVPVDHRAAGPRRGEPVLRRRHQPPRLGRALADRRVLRPELLVRPPRPVRREEREAHRRRHRPRRHGPRHDPRGAERVAVLYRDRRPETYGAITDA